MHTLRQKDGISGYTSRSESEFDPFGSGHGCNSISAGLGIFFNTLSLHFQSTQYTLKTIIKSIQLWSNFTQNNPFEK